MVTQDPTKKERIEVDLLLEAVYRFYGYDFRDYARASLKRRIEQRVRFAKLTHISEMIPLILAERDFFNSFLMDMSISVTEMFRDPQIFVALREKVFEALRTYSFLKIWHAGCATGEEVYSMAILLKEAGLYEKTQIYATDYNKHSLSIAQKGIYSLKNMRTYTENYQKAGGLTSFSEYYYAKYDSAIIRDAIKKNITFAHHNLVCDGVFGEMNLILCRNVLIYFNGDLQNRVLNLFSESLCNRGFLCLGSKESLVGREVENDFQVIAKKEKIYQKNET